MAFSIFRRQPSRRLSGGSFVRCLVGQNSCQIAEDFWEASSVTYYGVLKRYNGSTWIKEPLKVYNGSSFVTKSLKRYNGSTWVLVDTTGV